MQYINDASVVYNTKLSAEIDSLKQSLTNSKIAYIDIYNPLLDIIQNGQKYGNSKTWDIKRLCFCFLIRRIKTIFSILKDISMFDWMQDLMWLIEDVVAQAKLRLRTYAINLYPRVLMTKSMRFGTVFTLLKLFTKPSCPLCSKNI